MDGEAERQPLRLALHERTYQDVMTWLEDCDSSLLTELPEAATITEVRNRMVTLSTSKWIEVCEGLFGHASEFGGTWGRSADSLAQQITERVGGYFLEGLWVDDTDCEDDPRGEKDAALHGLF